MTPVRKSFAVVLSWALAALLVLQGARYLFEGLMLRGAGMIAVAAAYTLSQAARGPRWRAVAYVLAGVGLLLYLGERFGLLK